MSLTSDQIEPVTGEATADDARLLFVIDNDYGEMTLARFFVHGQALERRTTFLLPERLYAANHETPHIRTLLYASYRDILQMIDEEKPGIVFLCSGYLLPIHQLVSVPELGQLVEVLRNRGCGVITFDPFWGLMSTVDPLIALGGNKLTESLEVLRSVVHLYPAPFAPKGIPSTSFFNPNFIDASVPRLPAQFWEDAGAPAVAAESPYWLFALTREDYTIQVELYSKDGFTGRVVTMLANAFQAGRYVMLLAPEDCILSVQEKLGSLDGAGLVPYCSYDRFMPLLINAEYAFYWNAGSASAHLRMVRGLPVFTFDQGHIARRVRAWYQLMIQYYYHGWVPSYLDQDLELRADILAVLADGYRQAAAKIQANFATSPTPEKIIGDVLRELR